MAHKASRTRRGAERRVPAKAAPPPPLDAAQQAAIARLSAFAMQRMPLAVIVGSAGIGKSRLAAAIPAEFHLRGPARVVHEGAAMTSSRLLDAVAVALGIAPDDDEAFDAVIDALGKPSRTRVRTRIICIDDAQRMPADAIQTMVRLVSAAPTGSSRLCFVLLGRPELPPVLQLASNDPLMLHGCMWSLGGLSFNETRTYAAHRLQVNYPRLPAPTPSALMMIHMIARGVPARVGTIADDAGRMALMDGGAAVSLPIVLRVASWRARAAQAVPAALPVASAAAAMTPPARGPLLGDSGFRWASAAAGVALGLTIAHIGASYVVEPARAANDSVPTFTLALPEADAASMRRVTTVPVPAPMAEHAAVVRAPAVAPAVAMPGTPLPSVTPVAATPVAIPSASLPAAMPPADQKIASLAPRVELPPEPKAELRPDTRLAARAEVRGEPRDEPRGEARIEKRPHGARDDLSKAGDALAAGRNTEAIALLRKVLAAEPSNHDARANLVAVLADREGKDEWLAALSEAAIVDAARWGVTAAQAHAEHGHHDRAAAQLQSVPQGARDARYWSLAGLVYGKLERHQASLDAWQQALALTPPDTARHHATQIARAVALERLGRTDEARQVYQSIVSTSGPPANLLSFARSRLVSMGAPTQH